MATCYGIRQSDIRTQLHVPSGYHALRGPIKRSDFRTTVINDTTFLMALKVPNQTVCITGFTQNYTFRPVSIAVSKRICHLDRDSGPTIEMKVLVIYLVLPILYWLYQPFCLLCSRPTSPRTRAVLPPFHPERLTPCVRRIALGLKKKILTLGMSLTIWSNQKTRLLICTSQCVHQEHLLVLTVRQSLRLIL